MARLIAPNGVTVSVADGKAESLIGAGFRPADGEPTKASVHKTTTRRPKGTARKAVPVSKPAEAEPTTVPAAAE